MGIIYALSDPNDKKLYVGETTKELRCRMFEHMAGAFAPAMKSGINVRKNEWLRNLFEAGSLPIATVLENIPDTTDSETDKRVRLAREAHFVEMFRQQGFEVMNAIRGAVLIEWWQKKSPEERKKSARKSVEARTFEQRSESSRRGKARQTKERRDEIGKKISATLQALPAEERSRRAKLREENRRNHRVFHIEIANTPPDQVDTFIEQVKTQMGTKDV